MWPSGGSGWQRTGVLRAMQSVPARSLYSLYSCPFCLTVCALLFFSLALCVKEPEQSTHRCREVQSNYTHCSYGNTLTRRRGLPAAAATAVAFIFLLLPPTKREKEEEYFLLLVLLLHFPSAGRPAVHNVALKCVHE